MKENNTKRLTAVIFLSFLAVMLLGLLLLPKKDFSENEKRYLTRFPVPTVQNVLSGTWGEELETYLADRLPGRTFFVGLNAYYEHALGLQPTKEIRTTGEYLAEAPASADPAVIRRNLDVISKFADSIGQEVSLALVPSCGWALGGSDYEDEAICTALEEGAGGNLRTISLLEAFRGKPELYYRTDHHWNSAGAYTGYAALMEALGQDYRKEADFTREILPDCFRGSTYSRSALWLTKPETIELWHGSEAITAENREDSTIHPGVFYRERLEEADKYTVFLDGNHSLVTLRNPEKTGKLLVIRDSYSNSLGCFLAESYGEVVLVDLRYFKSPVSALVSQGFDDVLILYSVGNFMTDTNLVLLR